MSTHLMPMGRVVVDRLRVRYSLVHVHGLEVFHCFPTSFDNLFLVKLFVGDFIVEFARHQECNVSVLIFAYLVFCACMDCRGKHGQPNLGCPESSRPCPVLDVAVGSDISLFTFCTSCGEFVNILMGPKSTTCTLFMCTNLDTSSMRQTLDHLGSHVCKVNVARDLIPTHTRREPHWLLSIRLRARLLLTDCCQQCHRCDRASVCHRLHGLVLLCPLGHLRDLELYEHCVYLLSTWTRHYVIYHSNVAAFVSFILEFCCNRCAGAAFVLLLEWFHWSWLLNLHAPSSFPLV